MTEAESPLELMERRLSLHSILRDQERDNIRAKAADLLEGRTVWESTPLRLQIEPNRRCQLQCVHCDITHLPGSEMEFGLIEGLFREFGDGAIEVMPYTGGEPTLAPLDAIASLCRKHNTFMTFTTNGILLDGERFGFIVDACGRVIFSLHSHVPELFDWIEPRAGYARVLANLKACLKIAQPFDIQMMAGICLMDANIEGLADWFHFVADLGIRRVGFTSLHPNTPSRERIDAYGNRSSEEIADLVGRGMEVAMERGVFVETNVAEAYYTRFPENRPARRTRFDVLQDMNSIGSVFRPGFCSLAANMLTIEHDGTVLPCCRAHLVLGNLTDQSCREVWNGRRMQRLRETFFERRLFAECYGCMRHYSDLLHPTTPALESLGVSFRDEFGTA